MAVLQVGADGKAPAGAKVGDTIKTAGGDFKITGGSAGSWKSEKASAPAVTQNRPNSSGGSKVNKAGLSGQALTMADHLDNYGSYVAGLGNADLTARYNDKVNYFNNLGADQKHTAGVYRPTAVTNYGAANLGASKEAYDYRFDERTGKEVGNLNLINPNYDVFRDSKYNLLSGRIDQQFSDTYRDLVNSGKIEPDEETRQWFMSYRAGAEDKLMKNYTDNGMLIGADTPYRQAVPFGAPVTDIVAAPITRPAQAKVPVRPAQVPGQVSAPITHGAEPKGGSSYGATTPGANSSFNNLNVAELKITARGTGVAALYAQQKLRSLNIPW